MDNNIIENSKIPVVKIGFDKVWEAKNWYETVIKIPKYGLKNSGTKWNLGDIPEDVPRIIAEAGDKNEAESILKKRLEEEISKPEKRKIIEDAVVKAEKRWKKVAGEYFSLLPDLIDVPLENFEKVYLAYFTFSTRCPFYKNTFMFNKYLDFADNAMHEIMHIEFLKKYSKYCMEKGLNDDKIGHLKEILTALLNVAMKHLLSRPDRGYTKHQELRSKAVELYNKNKIFGEVLDGMIDLVKAANFN